MVLEEKKTLTPKKDVKTNEDLHEYERKIQLFTSSPTVS